MAIGIGEISRGVLKRILKLLPRLGNGVDDQVLMDGSTSCKQGRRYRDPDRTSHVAHQVEEAAGISDLFVGKGTVSGSGNRNKDEAKPKTGDENRNQQRVRGDVEGDLAKIKGHHPEENESEREQVAGVNPVGEVSDDRHPADGTDSARRDDEAGRKCGVSQELLVKQRENRNR